MASIGYDSIPVPQVTTHLPRRIYALWRLWRLAANRSRVRHQMINELGGDGRMYADVGVPWVQRDGEAMQRLAQTTRGE